MILNRARIIFIIVATTLASSSLLPAADVTWNNMFGSSLWNLTDPNWSTGLWNNANGDGAIFGATGAGPINVTDPINVNSLNFTANGYTLGGAGSLTFVNGNSSLGTGFINVEPSVTATINTAINSSLGLIKLGAGTLQLGGPMTFSGDGISLDSRGMLPTDLIVGGGSDNNFNPILGGTIQIMNSSVLPATARLGVANGLFDFGSNNITIAALNFVNQANNTAVYNPATGVAGAGVFGSGTLRVTGDISVLGVNTGNFNSNLIGSNLDLGGGTQVVRVASNGSFALARALGFTGTLSNGSLLKTFGVTENGIMGQPDGITLYGNNTYTGSTVLNGGPNIITGTNATSLVKIEGDRGAAAPNGTSLTLQGANGSLGSATTIQAFAGGQFIIDNNAALTSTDTPTIAAAQNNDRIRDDAEIQLRDGSFIYKGLAATAGSETFGNLSLQGGHNNVTLTPGASGGTVTVTANGNLTLAPRATLTVTSTTLGAASKFFINGTLPAADATGILSHVVGSTDFLTYNSTTGLTPFTNYATDFSMPGTNVALTAAATVNNSVDINALKRTGSSTTTIAAGQTLGITSGMNLQVSGTGTFTGGTIAFGSNPGAFFGGTASANTTVNSAITGSGGLINTNGTLTLNGDLSGLTGTITNDIGFATTTLATNTFAGPIEVRGGTFNITTSQTLAGQGAITMGVPANDAHLINNFVSLSFSSAPSGTIIGRDIIVDNGSNDAAGLATTFGFLPVIAPLSNSGTNIETLSGNITLNSPARLQGGGGTSGTGFTTLSGNISGPAQFFLANGRTTLSGSYSNAGGFRVGEQGFTSQATFTGNAIGSTPIDLEGGNNTFVAYNAGSLPTGTITVEGSAPNGFTAALNPLQNSTINNDIHLGTAALPGGTLTSNVASGVTGNWNGQVSGTGGLIKATGTGTLVLNANNTYIGPTAVKAGTLLVNGTSASSLHTVSSAAILGGNGSVGAVTVNTGGTLSPGSSVGTFATGNLSLSGTFLAEINLNNGGAASADLLNVSGTVNITGGTLTLSLSNLPIIGTPGTYLLVANDGSDAIAGTFASITGLPTGYTATVDYGFTGTDSLGRIGTGNDLAVQIVPEPKSYALFVLGGLFFVGLLRLRRRSA